MRPPKTDCRFGITIENTSIKIIKKKINTRNKRNESKLYVREITYNLEYVISHI